MKQAKPSVQDNQVLQKFLMDCEQIFEAGTDPRVDAEIPPRISDLAALDHIVGLWCAVGPVWRRVYFAGCTAIENACDPSLTFLEFKPELRANDELWEIVRELATGVLSHELIKRAQGLVAKLDELQAAPTSDEN